jgi:hypothetical protein
MENLAPQSSVKDLVLKQIEEGSVSATPRWRFAASTALSGFGLVAVFLFVLFLFTLVLFALREAGTFALPEFGAPGLRGFFLSLPWIPIVLIIVLAVVVEFWLLRYAFAYRQPLLYSVIGIAASLALGTVLVAAAKVHEGVYEVAETQNVPFVKPLYHSLAAPEVPYLHRGMVAELEDHGFELRGREGEMFTVFITNQTRIQPPTAIRVGEMVIVFGDNGEGQIVAKGVRHVNGMFFIEQSRR